MANISKFWAGMVAKKIIKYFPDINEIKLPRLVNKVMEIEQVATQRIVDIIEGLA